MTNDGWGDKWSSNPWDKVLQQDSGITPEMLGVKPEGKYEQIGKTITETIEWPNFDKTADAAMSKASGVPEDWFTHSSDATPEAAGVNLALIQAWPDNPVLTGRQNHLTTFEKGEVKHCIISQTFNDPQVTKAITKLVKENYDTSKLKLQGSNLVDNEKYLYFQCEICGDILDPHTKSFAKLQEYRVNAGWKCIWNIDGMGYKVYCTKCEEKVK